ncbi:class I SAM-dependent DNA methyltransferase, partial [PVC group bacterium]|nr:class I SAM-dependent DNA methyltransferase [PVC group bacterium]
MNAVEIEQAVSAFAEEAFDSSEFPYAFLTAFGNKSTTIKKLRKGDSNKSDLAGGLLQRNNIHIKVCDVGKVGETLKELLESPVTASKKCKYVLSTDGETIEAEYLDEGDTLACDYKDLANHFGFFLTLAGITTTKQIRENSFDIKATGRFNKLYIELLKNNPDWATPERKEDLNHFFARLIFCFFAEDTNIFNSDDMFTETIEQMSDSQSSNTHKIISEIFRAMNTDRKDRADGDFASWSDKFPYVNGGLFSGNTDVPCFSKIARSYLIHIGGLDWTKINPDIFGSMIQAVAEDDERSDVGLHYTSVSNILKVLNPLFLDDLREQLDAAGDSKRKLLNLRNRIAKIRVFDPACGSGNFLVIAYKEMREIEAEINSRRGEHNLHTQIPLTNFRGIEIRNFAAEIARLALIIAEYQSDLLYRGPTVALSNLLPLDSKNWITCGNALRLDWKGICPPTGVTTELQGDDLFNTPTDQSQIDFENDGGETYICGNPPYAGLSSQSSSQKNDIKSLFEAHNKYYKSFDYVLGWFWKSKEYINSNNCEVGFVTTNSICQGQQVPMFWKKFLVNSLFIRFAHTSFKWKNLARANAGVTVIVIGISSNQQKSRTI